MKKKFFIIINSILCMIILSGCWDTRELNTIGVVYAVGIEKDEITKEIICDVQVAIPASVKKDAPRNQSSVAIIEVRGDTVSNAINNITEKIDRFPDFSQNKIIIIDENAAQDGLFPILDFFKRSYQVRNVQWIAIAKPKMVKEIMGNQHGIGNIQGSYLNDIMTLSKFNSKIANINLMNFYKKALKPGTNPIAGAVQNMEEPNLPIERKSSNTGMGIKFSGASVFKGDKFIGYLNPEETTGYNLIVANNKDPNISIASTLNPNNIINIRIQKTKAQIKPEIIDNKIIFHINIKGEGNISELADVTNYNDTKIINQLENQQNIVLKNEIHMLMNKLQNSLHSDILGFGEALSIKYPKVWKEKKDNWDDVFSKAEYTVNTNVQIKRSGLMDKPIESPKLKY